MASPTTTTAATTEPEWLRSRRARAEQRIVELALPSFHDKAGWEFTPLGSLDLDAHPAGRAAESAQIADVLKVPAGAPRGGEAGERPAAGPVVLPLEVAVERHPQLIEAHLGVAVDQQTALTARNDARWSDGWLVHVPRGTSVAEPIVLTTSHEPGSTLHHRILVVVEDGAEAEVWMQMLSADPEGEGVLNGVVELFVGAGARLRYLEVQDLAERTWVFGSQRAIVQRDGHLEWTALGFGSANGKVFMETKLAEPGAHAQVTGAYATRGRQHLDYDTLQEHAAPNTTSDLAFRGVLAGRSSTVWRGMIKVDPGAQKTDAFQESRNLLISKRAHADAIPGLEILADDVRCTHAAAIAQIDPEQLFYLRSRGLPDETARRLVIEGFLQALMERFSEGETRDALAGALVARIERVLARA